MNILITGGTGFIGSNYCIKLFNSNLNVNKILILDKNSYCSNFANIKEIIHENKIIFINDDILNYKNNNKLYDIFVSYRITHIIHFAAQTHVDNSYVSIDEFIQDNIIATCVILENCKKYNKLEKIIMMSTDEIYGPSIHNELFENSSFNPTNPYSASKASSEMFINAYKHSYKLPIIIIRCNNVYGPKQFPEK